MKMTEKAKKYLAVGGGAVICIGLIAAISLQFGKAPAGEDVLPEESSTEAQIVVDPSSLATGTAPAGTEDKEVVIQPNTGTPAGGTEIGQPVDTRPAQTDQTEQGIQPEVTKPEAPSEETLTDPTTKPDGTKVDTPPAPVEHDTYTPPADTGNQNSGGGLPGFDNVPNGGENQVIDGQSDGDINKQVGTMD